MQVNSKKEAKEISQPFIHTITGFSYITVFVNDVDKVVHNAEKKGAQALRTKSPNPASRIPTRSLPPHAQRSRW